MIITENGLTHNNFSNKKIIGVEKIDDLTCHILTEDNNAFVFNIKEEKINDIYFDNILLVINYINDLIIKTFRLI